MNPEEILKRQKEEFKEEFPSFQISYSNYDDNGNLLSAGGRSITPPEVFAWHSASIKEILEGIVEVEKKKLLTLPKDPLDMTLREQIQQVVQPVYRPYKSNEESYNEAKSDTINYLESIIKKL